MRTCEAPGCESVIAHKFMLCRKHWSLIPQELQRKIVQLWQKLKDKDDRPKDEDRSAWRAARAEGLKIVAEKIQWDGGA